MSDPVQNVEIEDVLSSIRRLVSDGDKARTRDPAPSDAPLDEASIVAEEEPESIEQNDQTDRLVLTPAFLVVDADQDHATSASSMPAETDNVAPVAQEPEAQDSTDQDDGSADDPLRLTEMVWDEDKSDTNEPAEASTPDVSPDRADLVATIAELEAAISKSDEDYEPDGSEEEAETIAWPGATPHNTEMAEDATVISDDQDVIETNVEDGESASDFIDEPEAQDDAPILDAVPDQGEPDHNDALAQDMLSDAATNTTPSDAGDVIAAFAHRAAARAEADAAEDAEGSDIYGDDDLDTLMDHATAGLDETAIRALVAEVVRQELAGPMGEKITRNVRKLVRREIYRILSSQEFD